MPGTHPVGGVVKRRRLRRMFFALADLSTNPAFTAEDREVLTRASLIVYRMVRR